MVCSMCALLYLVMSTLAWKSNVCAVCSSDARNKHGWSARQGKHALQGLGGQNTVPWYVVRGEGVPRRFNPDEIGCPIPTRLGPILTRLGVPSWRDWVSNPDEIECPILTRLSVQSWRDWVSNPDEIGCPILTRLAASSSKVYTWYFVR